MTNVRLVVGDELKIALGGQIHIYQRVLFVGNSSQVEPPMKSDEDAAVQPARKPSRCEGYIVRAFAFRSGYWIGEWLKGHERLDTTTTDDGPGPVRRVIGRKTK